MLSKIMSDVEVDNVLEVGPLHADGKRVGRVKGKSD